MKSSSLFESAMTRAEVAAFDHLACINHATPGFDAHIGRPVEKNNGWAFALTEIPANAGIQFESAGRVGAIAQHARAMGSFARRADAQAWMMRIIGATPWSNLSAPGGNVQVLRIRRDGVGEIAFSSSTKTWMAEIGFDLVYLTGVQS